MASSLSLPRTTQLKRRGGSCPTARFRRRWAICRSGNEAPGSFCSTCASCRTSAWHPRLTHHNCARAIANQSRSTQLACVILLWCHPHSPRLKSLKPPSIQVRNPYQLTSASSGSRSVRMTQADSYPGSQCISKVPFTRPFLLAKHSTLPCQLVPGVDTHRLIQSKFSSPGKPALVPILIRKNGCQPCATMTSQSQRAYNPRSASTITSHSGGTAFPNSVSSPSQYGRQEPFCSAGITFQATGIAHPLRTTLTTKIVHRLPSDVASITSGNCRFSLFHKRNTHPSKGAKHVDTSRSRRFFPLFCPASRYHSRKR